MNIENLHQIDLHNKITNFHKLIGIKKDSRPEKIDRAVLAYARQTKHPLKIYLTNKQKNNPAFLLELYRLQPELTNARYPSDKLSHNYNFMIEYFKIRYHAKLLHDNIYTMMHFAPDLMSHPIFVERVAKEFPNENILRVVQYAEQYLQKYTYSNNIVLPFNRVPFELSNEVLTQQAKTHGSRFVALLPKNHPNYNNLVQCAAEFDGELSLKFLKNEKPKENKLKNKNKYKNNQKNDDLVK